jgi:hypothetical protein
MLYQQCKSKTQNLVTAVHKIFVGAAENTWHMWHTVKTRFTRQLMGKKSVKGKRKYFQEKHNPQCLTLRLVVTNANPRSQKKQKSAK